MVLPLGVTQTVLAVLEDRAGMCAPVGCQSLRSKTLVGGFASSARWHIQDTRVN